MLTPITRATRATRPLIDYPLYFERDYCPDCMIVHMVEVTRNRSIICHGENYFFEAQTAHTHYSRRLGKGFELVPITTPTQMPIEWIVAAETNEHEYIDIEQDF